MPYESRAEAALASLHAVERELQLTEPGSPEAEFLRATGARLRSEYRQLVEDVRGNGEPDPPPSPERSQSVT